jgi:hypothetical protein
MGRKFLKVPAAGLITGLEDQAWTSANAHDVDGVFKTHPHLAFLFQPIPLSEFFEFFSENINDPRGIGAIFELVQVYVRTPINH